MLKRIKIIQAFSMELKNKNIGSFAAGTAFFTFLSIFPIAMLVMSILPYSPVSAEQVYKMVLHVTPHTFEPILKSIIEDCYSKSVALISVSAIIMIWASAKGTLSLKYGLDAINGVVETRNYVFMRIQASIETLIMIIVMIVSIILMVFGNVLVDLVLRDFPRTQAFYAFMMKFRFVFSWAVLTLVFTTLYALFPNKKLRWKKQVPGAVFSAIVWSVFSWAFSLYVEYFQAFSMYGSFTTIIVSMIWLYSCMYIFLFGAYLNRYFRGFLLQLLAAGGDESEAEKEEQKEAVKRIFTQFDLKSGKKFLDDFRNNNAEIAEALRDPSLGLSEESQQEIMDRLRLMREQKKVREEQEKLAKMEQQ